MRVIDDNILNIIIFVDYLFCSLLTLKSTDISNLLQLYVNGHNLFSVQFNTVAKQGGRRGKSGGTRPGGHQKTFCSHFKKRFKQKFKPNYA